MSVPYRMRGVRILKAVSSPVRLQILNLLFDRGALSYSDLIGALKMNPNRDAGRFAYHLKFLLKANLVEADVEAKKYCLTELGKMVIDVVDSIEKKAFKPKRMLVRTSSFTLEEFDVNKIANSLVKEAKMPADLARKVAKEAEKRLVKSKTKYLTAPLVREVVNAILIEKGLEEYRHKLARLGLPVYDVGALINLKSENPHEMISVHEKVGEMVLKQYVLLNVFPRDIADAHFSGALHINGLGSWILKPSEVMHDLRFFFQNGLNLDGTDAFKLFCPPPQNLNSALSLTFNVLLHSSKETGEMQTLEYFNVFLAPFVKGLAPSEIKETLRQFIFNLNQHIKVSLGLELKIPDFLADKQAFGFSGKTDGNYGSFSEESQLLAMLLLDVFAEESMRKPLFNPNIIFKIRPETFADEKAKEILLKAYQLASERGMVYFANLLEKERMHSVFSASGFRLKANLSGDWEIDTLRTGNRALITLNMPRIAYECEGDETKFFQTLKERLELATRALEINYRALKMHGKSLLPFLMHAVNGDQYFRLESCSGIVNLVGLKEAVEAFYGGKVGENEKVLEFALEIAQNIVEYLHNVGGKRGKRLFTAVLPDFEASERLAQLDIERFGVAKVRYSGTREKPFYSKMGKLALHNGKVDLEFLKFENIMQELCSGGSLTVVELGEADYKPEELALLTKQLFEDYKIAFLTYDRKLTYCANCRKSWFGFLHKCPSCGVINTLTYFNMFAL
ncbi:MAG: anaerobic ribonucleoside-triphosphate reductase [Candidatus Bathyarchaeia archaeon]